MRVVVHTPGDGQAVVSFPNGGEIRDSLDGGQGPSFPVRVGAGGQVRLVWDGTRYSVSGGEATMAARRSSSPSSASSSALYQIPTPPTDPTSTTTTTSSTTTTTAPTGSTSTTSTTQPPPRPTGPSSGRPLWAVPAGGTTGVVARARQYRGVVEATAERGPFRLVNQVDVETYLKGMGEVRNPKWPAAGLRAQAVAARTYALRAMAANGEICDTQRCQVYLGSTAEYSAMNKAVDGTRGQVLLFGKKLASAVYSANGGAHSASRQEGFGVPDDGGHPYLRPAPYPTDDPLPWKVEVALTDVAARLGYKGSLSEVRVAAKGPSGRATAVLLRGSAGDKEVTGLSFAKSFSLKSTLFTLGTGTSDAAPPPPPSGDGLQAPPEDAGPAFDPNVLPPDPLTPDELAAVVPDPGLFTPAPLEALAAAPRQPREARSLPLLRLGAFFALVAAAGTVGWHLLQTRLWRT